MMVSFLAVFSICVYLLNGQSEWKVAPWSHLPRAGSMSAIGYDNTNQLIWILGGWQDSKQLVSFDINKWNDPDAFIDYGNNTLPYKVWGGSQVYTQKDDILYILQSNSMLSTFKLSQQQFTYNWNNVTAPIPGGIGYYSCLSHIDDYLIVSGGYYGETLSVIEIYNISSDEWLLNVANMIQERMNFACIVSETNQYLYSMGGYTLPLGTHFSNIEKLYVGDLNNIHQYESIMLTDTLSIPQYALRVIIIDTNIYVFGYPTDNTEIKIDIIDTRTDKVASIDKLKVTVRNSAPIAVNNRIYVFGGENKGIFNGIKDFWQYYSFPTQQPTMFPTAVPTTLPSNIPSVYPTTYVPTSVPTSIPTSIPSIYPTTSVPTTSIPTTIPTTYVPTSVPTSIPSIYPTTSVPTLFKQTEDIETTQYSPLSTELSLEIFILIIVISIVGIILIVICLYYIITKTRLRTTDPGNANKWDTIKKCELLHWMFAILEVFDMITDYLFAASLIMIDNNNYLNILGWISLGISIIGVSMFAFKYSAYRKIYIYQVNKFKNDLKKCNDPQKQKELIKEIRCRSMDINIISLLGGCLEDIPHIIIVIMSSIGTKWNHISILKITLSALSFILKLTNVIITKLGCSDESLPKRKSYQMVQTNTRHNIHGDGDDEVLDLPPRD